MTSTTTKLATDDLPPRPRWATLSDAAGRAGVAKKTVRSWIAKGLLPGYRFGPRNVRVDLDDLDAVVARRIPTGRGGAA